MQALEFICGRLQLNARRACGCHLLQQAQPPHGSRRGHPANGKDWTLSMHAASSTPPTQHMAGLEVKGRGVGCHTRTTLCHASPPAPLQLVSQLPDLLLVLVPGRCQRQALLFPLLRGLRPLLQLLLQQSCKVRLQGTIACQGVTACQKKKKSRTVPKPTSFHLMEALKRSSLLPRSMCPVCSLSILAASSSRSAPWSCSAFLSRACSQTASPGSTHLAHCHTLALHVLL